MWHLQLNQTWSIGIDLWNRSMLSNLFDINTFLKPDTLLVFSTSLYQLLPSQSGLYFFVCFLILWSHWLLWEVTVYQTSGNSITRSLHWNCIYFPGTDTQTFTDWRQAHVYSDMLYIWERRHTAKTLARINCKRMHSQQYDVEILRTENSCTLLPSLFFLVLFALTKPNLSICL